RITLKNTILSAAPNTSDNCNAPITDSSNNLQYPGTSCGMSIPAGPVYFGPLNDNGGSTLTMALFAGSPAIDAGDNAACAASPVNGVDQRVVWRPIDGNGDGIAVCDIGAYESPDVSHLGTFTPAPTFTSTPSFTPSLTPISTFTSTPGPTSTRTRTATSTS